MKLSLIEVLISPTQSYAVLVPQREALNSTPREDQCDRLAYGYVPDPDGLADRERNPRRPVRKTDGSLLAPGWAQRTTIGRTGAVEAIEEICFMPRRISWIALLTFAGVMAGWIDTAAAQPPPPDGKDKKGDKKGKDKKGGEIELFQDRLERLRWQLQFTRPADKDCQTLLQHSVVYADRADQMWRTQPYIADRTLAGAESLFHACDHLQRFADAPGFPAPPAPAEVFGRRRAGVFSDARSGLLSSGDARQFVVAVADDVAAVLSEGSSGL